MPSSGLFSEQLAAASLFWLQQLFLCLHLSAQQFSPCSACHQDSIVTTEVQYDTANVTYQGNAMLPKAGDAVSTFVIVASAMHCIHACIADMKAVLVANASLGTLL